MNRVRKLSTEVLEKYDDSFGENFEDNKRALMEISVITSKELKNEIAGFITKTKKRATRERLKEEADQRAREEAAEAEALEQSEGSEDGADGADSDIAAKDDAGSEGKVEGSEDGADGADSDIAAKDDAGSEGKVEGSEEGAGAEGANAESSDES